MDPITEIEVAHAFDLGLLNSSADIVFRVYQTTFRVHQTTLVPKDRPSSSEEAIGIDVSRSSR